MTDRWDDEVAVSGAVATRVGPALVVTLPRELDGATLRALRTDALDALRSGRSRALVLEASGLDLIDAEDFAQLTLVARSASLLGVRPLLVGLSAGVVAYLVDAGVDTRGVVAYATLDDALMALGAAGHGADGHGAAGTLSSTDADDDDVRADPS